MIRYLFATTAVAAALAAPLQLARAQSASAPTSPAKKELVAKVLKLQQPGVDNLARQLIEQPLTQMLQQVSPALQQRVAADRREAVARDIQADARKYAEELGPTARDKAAKLAPTVLGPMLEEKFSEEELRQLIAIIESPVNRKYQSLGVEMQRTLGEKLVAEMRPLIEPKLRALQQTVAGRLAPAASSPNR